MFLVPLKAAVKVIETVIICESPEAAARDRSYLALAVFQDYRRRERFGIGSCAAYPRPARLFRHCGHKRYRRSL